MFVFILICKERGKEREKREREGGERERECFCSRPLLPYDTGKPFGPRRLNLFKSAQLQGAWLPAPSPRRRRSLRTPRVLWLGLVQLMMFKALSILSGIWHRHAEFVIWEVHKWLVVWRKTKQENHHFLPSTSGVPMVPLACSCSIAGSC